MIKFTCPLNMYVILNLSANTKRLTALVLVQNLNILKKPWEKFGKILLSFTLSSYLITTEKSK